MEQKWKKSGTNDWIRSTRSYTWSKKCFERKYLHGNVFVRMKTLIILIGLCEWCKNCWNEAEHEFYVEKLCKMKSILKHQRHYWINCIWDARKEKQQLILHPCSPKLICTTSWRRPGRLTKNTKRKRHIRWKKHCLELEYWRSCRKCVER